MPEKLFSKILISLTIFIALSVCIFNYAVNPKAEFGHQLVAPVVQLSRRDKVRLYPAYVRRGGAPDVVIMGSSRSMEARAGDFERLPGAPYQRAFHFGINSSNVEDAYASLLFILDSGDAPDIILLAQDFRNYNPAQKTDKRFFAVPELACNVPAQYLESGWRASMERYSALPSFEYLRHSLQALKMELSASAPPPVFGPNGDVLKERFGSISDEDVRGAFSDMLCDGGDYYGYSRLSEKRKELLEIIYDLASENRIRVVTWLTTLHPVLYASVMDTPHLKDRYNELVSWEMELAARYDNVVFIDIVDPALIRCSGDQFRDPTHYSRECAKVIETEFLIPALAALTENKMGGGL